LLLLRFDDEKRILRETAFLQSQEAKTIWVVRDTGRERERDRGRESNGGMCIEDWEAGGQ
jgi:hypothetical protein